MPCLVDPTDDEIRASREASVKREKDIRNTISNLARMLCAMCKEFEHNGLEIENEIYDWWIQHKKEDAKRMAAAKQSGLAKLSDDEREALGLL